MPNASVKHKQRILSILSHITHSYICWPNYIIYTVYIIDPQLASAFLVDYIFTQGGLYNQAVLNIGMQ